MSHSSWIHLFRSKKVKWNLLNEFARGHHHYSQWHANIVCPIKYSSVGLYDDSNNHNGHLCTKEIADLWKWSSQTCIYRYRKCGIVSSNDDSRPTNIQLASVHLDVVNFFATDRNHLPALAQLKDLFNRTVLRSLLMGPSRRRVKGVPPAAKNAKSSKLSIFFTFSFKQESSFELLAELKHFEESDHQVNTSQNFDKSSIARITS